MVHFYTPWISRGAKWNIGVKWVSDAVLVTWILLLLLLLSLIIITISTSLGVKYLLEVNNKDTSTILNQVIL